MDEHDSAVPRRVRRLYVRESMTDGRVAVRYYTIACQHCAEAACVKACPRGCYFREESSGFVLQNAVACTHCGQCAAACPFHAIAFARDGRAYKCDVCLERRAAGQTPRCVESCRVGAITAETSDASEHAAHTSALRAEVGELITRQGGDLGAQCGRMRAEVGELITRAGR
jgi:Fe-S-cluster-containing dehydrogenase component